MNLWQNYIRPKNLSEAMDAFAHAPRPLMPIAGGTDLLLDLEQGRHSPVQTLIDVTSVAEMTALEVRGDELYIGASVPVNRVATTPEVATHAQALTEACNLIAGPQVRNVATSAATSPTPSLPQMGQLHYLLSMHKQRLLA